MRKPKLNRVALRTLRNSVKRCSACGLNVIVDHPHRVTADCVGALKTELEVERAIGVMTKQAGEALWDIYAILVYFERGAKDCTELRLTGSGLRCCRNLAETFGVKLPPASELSKRLARLKRLKDDDSGCDD